MTFLLYLNHDTSQEFFWRTTTVDKELKKHGIPPCLHVYFTNFFISSMRTTVASYLAW